MSGSDTVARKSNGASGDRLAFLPVPGCTRTQTRPRGRFVLSTIKGGYGIKYDS